MEMFPTIIREIISIFEQAFPFLKELILEDKVSLIYSFLNTFVRASGRDIPRLHWKVLYHRGILSIFITYSDQSVSKYNHCTLATFVFQFLGVSDYMHRLRQRWSMDKRQGFCWTEGRFSRVSDFCSFTQEDFVLWRFVRNYSDEYTALLLPLFTLEKVEETEFMALLILGFCDVGKLNICVDHWESSVYLDLTLDLPEFIFEKLESIRKDVFAELQDYYKREEVSDVSTRMGMLMTVAHSTSVSIMIIIFLMIYSMFITGSGASHERGISNVLRLIWYLFRRFFTAGDCLQMMIW